jgi:hypothetical protein
MVNAHIYTSAALGTNPSAELSELCIYSVLPPGLRLRLAAARVRRVLCQPGELRVVDARLGVQVT